jgi:hypothetical protein
VPAAVADEARALDEKQARDLLGEWLAAGNAAARK